MPSLNDIQIIGTLTKDPEIRRNPNGSAVCKLLVVTDESYTSKQSGKYIEEVEWHVVKLFNQQAEHAYQYMRKGNLIYTRGSKRTRDWMDNGVKRYFTEIRAYAIQKLDNKGTDTLRALPDYTTEPTAEPVANQATSSHTASQGESNNGEPDALYDAAVEFVREQNSATISGLQRHLKVGYNRAARLIETMETDGIISDLNPDGSRTVIATGKTDPVYDEAVAIVTAQQIVTTDGLHKKLKTTYAHAAQLLDIMASNSIVSKETNGTRTVIKK